MLIIVENELLAKLRLLLSLLYFLILIEAEFDCRLWVFEISKFF